MSQALLGRYAATVWGVCVWNHPDFQIHSLSSWNDYAGDLQLLGSTRYTYKFFGSSEFEILNTDTELLWWNLGMRQWVKKKGASVPASTGCDDNCCCCWWKCPEIGDWELLLYCICDYIPSPSLYILFFPLPETPTCEHTLWKWNTQSSLCWQILHLSHNNPMQHNNSWERVAGKKKKELEVLVDWTQASMCPGS